MDKNIERKKSILDTMILTPLKERGEFFLSAGSLQTAHL